MQRAPRKPKRRRSHRRSKDIQRGHGDLEALSGIAQALRCGNPAVFKHQPRERMGRHYLNAFRDLKAVGVRVDDEGRDSLRSRCFACPCKDQ